MDEAAYAPLGGIRVVGEVAPHVEPIAVVKTRKTRTVPASEAAKPVKEKPKKEKKHMDREAALAAYMKIFEVSKTAISDAIADALMSDRGSIAIHEAVKKIMKDAKKIPVDLMVTKTVSAREALRKMLHSKLEPVHEKHSIPEIMELIKAHEKHEKHETAAEEKREHEKPEKKKRVRRSKEERDAIAARKAHIADLMREVKEHREEIKKHREAIKIEKDKAAEIRAHIKELMMKVKEKRAEIKAMRSALKKSD